MCESGTSCTRQYKNKKSKGQREIAQNTHSGMSVAAAVRKIVKLWEDAVRVVADNSMKVQSRTAAAGSGGKD